jgi:hypothetical protein
LSSWIRKLCAELRLSLEMKIRPWIVCIPPLPIWFEEPWAAAGRDANGTIAIMNSESESQERRTEIAKNITEPSTRRSWFGIAKV